MLSLSTMTRLIIRMTLYDHSLSRRLNGRNTYALPGSWPNKKLSYYYAEVTLMTAVLLLSAHNLDSFRKLQSFRKWVKGMDINPEDETSYNTPYTVAFLKYLENEYCTKHRHLPIIKPESALSNNWFPSAMASASGQSLSDPSEVSSDDEEYLTYQNVAEKTPGRSDHTALILTAPRCYFNSPLDLPKHWGLVIPNLNDYHSDPMEISSTIWIPDITDWWRQLEETHSEYADFSIVACDIFSLIPHGVGVRASFSQACDIISWRKSKTTGETLREKLISRQFAGDNNRIRACDDPALDTTKTENINAMK